MTDDDVRDLLAWRNLAVQWHLQQELPLDCGCDDDTEDHEFCGPSTFYADSMFAARTDPKLEGLPDKWSHDVWVAAWGRNAPMIVNETEYRLPKAPESMDWLLTRLLVGGRQALELTLLKLSETRVTPLHRVRVAAEPSTVVARARAVLAEIARKP